MMKHWMFKCREVTGLVSKSFDEKLPLFQRIGMWVHLFMCKLCSENRRQMMFLREAMRFYAKHDEEMESYVSLPPEAKERIKSSLRPKQPES
jgi:hypothetical protein